MKKWKTLKVLLGVLCAMLAAIGLFACKSGSGSIASITSVKGTSNLSYTDGDTWESIVQSLEKKVTMNCRPKKGDTFTLEGKDLTFSSTIEFDANKHCKVGNYTITIAPKKNNPSNQSRTATIEIAHNFPNSGESVVTCQYASCGATKTSAEENSIIHYGTFHKGTDNEVPAAVFGEDETAGKVFTNKKAGTTYIKEFGTATVDGEVVTVPTLTVGRLEPGMTITVTGTAQTKWSEWGVAENAYYYFPVIGIADRTLNDPEWQDKNGTTKTDTTQYAGGTSVFVRGEGWVLYNGIGNVGTYKTRALGALSSYASGGIGNGEGEARNYGSHENATPDEKETPPVSFTAGKIPSVNEWVDWVVYSTGTTSNSGNAYGEETPITLTWNYRQDKIIELTYDVGGNKLLCMIKVPDSSAGYYDTILHGDYVDMKITSYELIETRTPDELFVEVKNDTYYEGQTFDPAKTISAQFTYKQSGSEKFPQPLSLENIYATTDDIDVEDEEAVAGANWVSMEENPVLATYKAYKVEVLKGNRPFTYAFKANAIKVVLNYIGSVSGADVGNFYNYNTVGKLELSAKDDEIILTPKGTAYAQAIPANDTTLTGTTAAHRYVALNITALEGKTLGEIAVEDGVPYSYSNGQLVLAITSEKKSVKITGLNASPTVFDFSSAFGFSVSSTIERVIDSENPGDWYLNNTENTVRVTFEASENRTLEGVDVGGNYRTPEKWVEYTDGEDYSFNGITVKAGATYVNGVLSMEIVFPAANIASYSACSISAVTDDNEEAELVYGVDYVPNFVQNETVDKDYYTFVSDGKIYLAQIADGGENALALNINAGDDNIELLNLNYKYDAATGSVAFKSRSVKGAEISVLPVAGAKIILIAVDPSQIGVKGNTFGYQIKTENYSTYYFAVSGNDTVKTEISTGTSMILNEGSCLENGLSGTKVGTTDAMFIANVSITAGKHDVRDGACSICGATVKDVEAPTGWFEGTYTYNGVLAEGNFLEFIGTFSEDGTKALGSGSDYYAYSIVIPTNNKINYVLGGDGFLSKRSGGEYGWDNTADPYVDTTAWDESNRGLWDNTGAAEELSNSLITEDHPYNTLNGWVNKNGEEINAGSYNADRVGGTFRYTFTRTKDSTVLVARFRIWKQGENIVTGTPFVDFTYKLDLAAYTSIQLMGSDNEKSFSDSTLKVYTGLIDNLDHEHDWDETAHCKVNGCAAIYQHEHSYVNGVCSVCSVICTHETAVDNVCPVCHGVFGIKTETEQSVTGTSINAGTGKDDWNSQMFKNFVVNQGEIGAISGTQTRTLKDGATANNYDGVNFEFTQGLTMRSDAFCWTYGNAWLSASGVAKMTDNEGKSVTTDWVKWANAIANDCTWVITIDFTGTAPVVTSAFTANSGEYEGWTLISTYACTWAANATNKTTVTMQLGPCGGDSTYHVEASVTKTTMSGWTWNTTSNEE